MSQEQSASHSPSTLSNYAPPSPVPVVIVGEMAPPNGDDEKEETDVSPFFEYLRSPEGHEIAKSVIGIIQDIKKAALTSTTGQIKLEKTLQIGIVFAVIIAASILAGIDKLSTPVGILFGTLVGYVFGRKSG